MSTLRIAYLDPAGRLVERTFDSSLAQPIVIERPSVPPPVDEPWVTEPGAVVEDIWPWIASNCTALSPDGRVAWIQKSDEVSAEGRVIGEWWDVDAEYIGHVEDASQGLRIYQGRSYTPKEWVALGEPVPWATLRINRNTFKAGARLWMPRRCVTGWTKSYRTNITFTTGYVDPNVPVTIRVEVGRGVHEGREARVRVFYDPRRRDQQNPKRKAGNLEENWIGPSGWVRHLAWKDDAEGRPVIPVRYGHEEAA